MDQAGRDDLYMETAVPQPGRVPGRGALTAVLLAAAVFLNVLRRRYGVMLPFSPLWMQLPAYALLLLWAYGYARRRLTAYRYTLTDETFTVERLTDARVRVILSVPRTDILPDGGRVCRTVAAFTGRRRDAGTLMLLLRGRRIRVLHSMSAEMQARFAAAREDV